MSYVIFLVVASILMLVGIPLVFTPFPSLLFMMVVAVGFGFVDNFTHLSGGELGILAGVFALSILVDQLSGILGARYSGASAKSIFYGMIGMILGTIILPPFGGMVGLFVAVVLSEYKNHQDHSRALKAGAGSFIGMLAGKIACAVIGLIFLIMFIVFAI
jgi:hypothetical protein